MRPVEARPRQNPQGEGLLCQPAVSEDRVTDACLASAVPGYRWAMEVVPLRVYKALPAGNVLVASTGANSSPRYVEASWQDDMSEAQGLSDRVLYGGG